MPMRLFIAAMIVAAFSAQSAHAQGDPRAPNTKPPGLAEKQKAEEMDKRAYRKSTDDAYKAAIGRVPDAKPNADPWGNLRAPAAPSGQK